MTHICQKLTLCLRCRAGGLCGSHQRGHVDANLHKSDVLSLRVIPGLNFGVGPILFTVFGLVENFNAATQAIARRSAQGLQRSRIGFATTNQSGGSFADGFFQAVPGDARKALVHPGNATLYIRCGHRIGGVLDHLGQQAQVGGHGTGPGLGDFAPPCLLVDQEGQQRTDHGAAQQDQPTGGLADRGFKLRGADHAQAEFPARQIQLLLGFESRPGAARRLVPTVAVRCAVHGGSARSAYR